MGGAKPFRKSLQVCFFIIFTVAFVVFICLNMLSTMSYAQESVESAKRNEASLIVDIVKNFQKNLLIIHDIISDSYVLGKIYDEEQLSENTAAFMNVWMNTMETKSSYLVRDMEIPFHIVAYSKNGLKHVSRSYEAGHDFSEIEGSKWLANVRRSGKVSGYINNKEDYNNGTEDSLFYISYVNYYNVSVSGSTYLATIAVRVDSNWIASLFEDSIGDGSQIYIFDESGDFFSSNTIGANEEIPQAIRSFLDGDESLLRSEDSMMVKYESDSGFTVIETVPESVIYSKFISGFAASIIAAVAVFAAGAVLINYMSGSLTSPLSEFCEKIKGTSYSDAIEKPENIKYREIDLLYSSYSFLRARNLALFSRQIENEKRIKDEEIRFLRAQINPHFLYNTLFSIKCTAKLGRVDEACRMLDLLGDMFRKNLHSADETQPICDEIIAIKDYIEIVECGMDNKLSFVYEVEDHLQYRHIMKFLLQPLVENSIFHGIKPKETDGRITIAVKERDGKLEIMVRDNGVGMSNEAIQRFMSDTDDGCLKFQGHVGITNVRLRIRENYGPDYNMSITSKEGEGTKIILTLPLLMCGN